MKLTLPRFGSLLTLGATALCLAAAPVGSSAQTTAAVPAPASTTYHGRFQTSAGRKGTFVTTVTVSGPVKTTQTVYTLADGTGSRTDTAAVTKNGDGSLSYQVSDGLYGGGAYTTSYTLSKIKGGKVGTGTFTDEKGATGSVEKLVLRGTESTVRAYATGVNAGKSVHYVDTEYNLGRTRRQYVDLFTDATGATTSTVTTLTYTN